METTTELVDPTGASEAAGAGAGSPAFTLAPRQVGSLDGKVVGLVDSTKRGSDHLLDGLERLLRDRYAVADVVREQKPYFGNPIPDDQARRLADRCDVVVTGVGD